MKLKLNEQGLIPAIAQDAGDGTVLMVAWMNREALEETLATGQVTYWSRSRNRLWRKGETSGQTQRVVDGDFLLDPQLELVGLDHDRLRDGDRVGVRVAAIQPGREASRLSPLTEVTLGLPAGTVSAPPAVLGTPKVGETLPVPAAAAGRRACAYACLEPDQDRAVIPV